MKNRITIETDDLALIEQIQLLIKDVQGLKVTLDTFSISERAVNLMNQIAESGGSNAISDPVTWQKETRKDRALPFRN
jgi:hypothetical protein